MNDPIAWLDQFSNGLRGNRKFLVLVTCWCLGFLLKKIKGFPNNLIPLFVIPLGATFSLLIDDHHTPELPLWQERLINFAIGFILSTAAWVSHRVVWKNLRKLPVIGQYLDTGNSDPKAFVKGQNAEIEELKPKE